MTDTILMQVNRPAERKEKIMSMFRLMLAVVFILSMGNIAAAVDLGGSGRRPEKH